MKYQRLSTLTLAFALLFALPACDSSGDDNAGINGDLSFRLEGPEGTTVGVAENYFSADSSSSEATNVTIDGDGSIEQDLEDGHGGVRVTATLGHGTDTSLTLSLLSDGEVIDETSEANTEHGVRVYAVEAGEIPDFSEE
jgi:hypothetical protein